MKKRFSFLLIAAFFAIGAAFANSNALLACKSGPASDSSQCPNTNQVVCCITQNNETFYFSN